MPNAKPRVRTRTAIIPLTRDLALTTTEQVRITSRICHLDRGYARYVERLAIQLSKEDFITVIDDINSILKSTSNVTILSLVVDRLPTALQHRVYSGVVLSQLTSLSVSSSSLQALRTFLHTHRHTIRDLSISLGTRRSTMVARPALPALELSNIIGSTSYVVGILAHCNTTTHMSIRLTEEARTSILQRFYPVLHQYSITSLGLTVEIRHYGVLATLAMCFPRLQRLKIIEKGFRKSHVWSSRQAWVQALQGHTNLSRLSLQVARAVDAEAIHPKPWFPYGTSIRDIEYKVDLTLLGIWKREHNTNDWYFVDPSSRYSAGYDHADA